MMREDKLQPSLSSEILLGRGNKRCAVVDTKHWTGNDFLLGSWASGYQNISEWVIQNEIFLYKKSGNIYVLGTMQHRTIACCNCRALFLWPRACALLIREREERNLDRNGNMFTSIPFWENKNIYNLIFNWYYLVTRMAILNKFPYVYLAVKCSVLLFLKVVWGSEELVT